VAKTIIFCKKEKQAAVLLITHYAKILDFLSIDRVHILSQGKIIKSATKTS
jgi:Fe-S cluster assembly ATP-binding protein